MVSSPGLNGLGIFIATVPYSLLIITIYVGNLLRRKEFRETKIVFQLEKAGKRKNIS